MSAPGVTVNLPSGSTCECVVDDLQAIADDCLKQRKKEIARCEQIIAEKVKALLETKSSADFADERRLLLPHLRKSV